MGRWRALPLMMSLFLLAGCAGGEGGEPTGEELALAIQTEFAQMTACTCRAGIHADYGDKVFDCVVDVTYDAAAGAELTLVEPELARGVTARIARGETSLRYGTFSLDVGPLTGDGLSPVGAVPALWGQIARGYIAGAELEEGALTVTYRQGDDPPGVGLESEVTFDAQSHAPLLGELYYDGARVVTVEVSDFQMLGPQDGG